MNSFRYKLKKQYIKIRRKYLSWFMAFGQAGDKTGIAYYKIKSFESTIYPSTPNGLNIFWMILRAIAAVLVHGMGTFERMRVPDTKFLFNLETCSPDEYYDQWVSYYAEVAQLYGADNNQKTILYLINEFYSQNSSASHEQLLAFIKALEQNFGKEIIAKISITSPDHTSLHIDNPEISTIPNLSEDERRHPLIKLYKLQGKYQVTLEQFNLILELDNTRDFNTVTYKPPSLSNNNPATAQQNHELYASYYRVYTKINEHLTTKDDYSAAILMHMSDAEKSSLVINDAMAIENACYYIQDNSLRINDVLLEINEKISSLQHELSTADVFHTKSNSVPYLAKYSELRELIYIHHLSLLWIYDRKNYDGCVKLIKQQNKHEQLYLARLCKLQVSNKDMLIALSYQREDLKGYLAANYAGKFEKFFKGRFSSFISIMNVIVLTIFAYFSIFNIFVLFYPPLAIPLAIAAGIVTAFTSMSFGKNSIRRTFGKFGRTLDWMTYRYRNKNRIWTILFNSIIALSTIVTAPLFYFSAKAILLPWVKAVCSALLIGSLANPIGIAICGFCVAMATIATTGLACSQGFKLSEMLRKFLGTNSALYKQAQYENRKFIYWTVVAFAVLVTIAAISVSVVGDVFGVNAVFNLKADLLFLPAIFSFIYTAAQDIADVISHLLKFSFKALGSNKADTPADEPPHEYFGTYNKLSHSSLAPGPDAINGTTNGASPHDTHIELNDLAQKQSTNNTTSTPEATSYMSSSAAM